MTTNSDIYASLATRIKASIIDGLILITLFLSTPMVIGVFSNNDSPIKAIAMFAPLILLEPILVTYLGSTIGQYIFGIKVIRVDSRSNCNLYVSFFRYVAKTILGSISLVYMLFSRKHQAIHDHLTNTVVLISQKKLEKNPQLFKHGEMEQTFNHDYAYPSAIRRFILFIVWYFLACIVLGIVVEVAAVAIIPRYTIDDGKLPEVVDNILSILLAIVFIALAVVASKGCLPGARRKRLIIDDKSLPWLSERTRYPRR